MLDVLGGKFGFLLGMNGIRCEILGKEFKKGYKIVGWNVELVRMIFE